MNIATMDRVGRLVLPRKVREQLHLQEGARFRVAVVAGKVELELEPEDDSELTMKDGVLVLAPRDPNKRGKPGDIRAAIKADREARMKRVRGDDRR
jgi:AbrB family looped-hinge helix DNA binding protein